MRTSVRRLTSGLIAAALVLVGCGRTDDRGAEIIQEMLVMRETLTTASRSGEPAIVGGRSGSEWRSWSRGSRRFVPAADDRGVYDELRVLAIADGWEIDRVDEPTGSFVATQRQIEGRWFDMRTGFDPIDGEIFVYVEQGPRRLDS